MNSQVWFITGCSTGFGREIADLVLEMGHRAVVTARKKDKVEDIAQKYGDKVLALELDVTDPKQVSAAVKQAGEKFGGIDVLVNNAGIGYFGSFEESELAEARVMFEINVWGLVAMTRAVLPGMRSRKSGTIVNFSSLAGIATGPGLSFYHGTKFAVEGLSEALSQEVSPLGIRVMLVEPGPFRTDWAGRSAKEAPQTIADYKPTAGARVEMMRKNSGKQPGDPARAAKAIVKALELPNPPFRLILGKVALNAALAKLDALKKNFEGWTEITLSADFPEK
jgi:NADP-dependent 3-hydroxy acid dehydrogenase YdfG